MDALGRVILVCLVLGGPLAGCQGPTFTMLVGTWVNADGASLLLKGDGTFSAHGLPGQVFLRDTISGPLTGTGRWSLERHNSLWHGDGGIVTLEFERLPGYPARMGIELILSPAGTLYQWKGEEGGERYELQKK